MFGNKLNHFDKQIQELQDQLDDIEQSETHSDNSPASEEPTHTANQRSSRFSEKRHS
jgi:prefoldin subunit 5